ncbi:MAG TPA: hypothetical protein VGG92_01685, partial [Caulobacteraceae bacterium]
ARWQDLPDALEFAAGGLSTILLLVGCLAVGLLHAAFEKKNIRLALSSGEEGRLWIVPATALASVAICVVAYEICLAASLARPMLVVRYFTPATPGVMLGVALITKKIGDLWRPLPAVMLGTLGVAVLMLLGSGEPKQQPISFERASAALMKAGVSRVEFFYDDRGAGGRDHDAFSKIGGFFFHRAGQPILADAVFIKQGVDPSPVLLARAQGSGTAILWVYDTTVDGTAAVRFPPRISLIDPRWRCRDYGTLAAHALACVRAGAL